MFFSLPYSTVRAGDRDGAWVYGWQFVAAAVSFNPILLLWPGACVHLLFPAAVVLTARRHRAAVPFAVGALGNAVLLAGLWSSSWKVASLPTVAGVPPAFIALVLATAAVTAASLASLRRTVAASP